MGARLEEVKKELLELWGRVRAEVLDEEHEYPSLCTLVVRHNGEEVDRIDDTKYVVRLPGTRGYLIIDAENLVELNYGETISKAYMSYLRRIIANQGKYIDYVLSKEGVYSSNEWLIDELEEQQKSLEKLLMLYRLAKEDKLQFELEEVE